MGIAGYDLDGMEFNVFFPRESEWISIYLLLFLIWKFEASSFGHRFRFVWGASSILE